MWSFSLVSDIHITSKSDKFTLMSSILFHKPFMLECAIFTDVNLMYMNCIIIFFI